MGVCPICNGEGKKIFLIKNMYTNRYKTVTDWCICKKSEFVSKNYTMLVKLGEHYLPLDKVNKGLVFKPKELHDSPNLYIRATDLETFSLHIKSIIMKYRFRSPPPFIYYCKAIDILKRFFVKQLDGSNPSLSDLDRCDLLIFTLGTQEKNDHVGTCLTQVMSNRACIGKPTWIFLPVSTVLENTREFTSDLKEQIESEYKTVLLTDGNIKVTPIKTATQNKADRFRI